MFETRANTLSAYQAILGAPHVIPSRNSLPFTSTIHSGASRSQPENYCTFSKDLDGESSGASIRTRYARNDKLGTPPGVAVVFDAVANGSLTLREHDGTSQVRGSEEFVIIWLIAQRHGMM